jgi:uncharacterized protein YcnI
MSFLHRVAAIAALAIVAAPGANAHITLEQQQAAAKSTYKAVLRVPHGCEGSATVRVRVQIPDGVLNVKPQPKAGWELTTVRGPLSAPVAGDHGTTVTEGVKEVIWSGGKLPDAFYDEFVFRGQLPDRPGETLYVPVIQDCEKGSERWIEIPASGQKIDDLKFPAPILRIAPRP